MAKIWKPLAVGFVVALAVGACGDDESSEPAAADALPDPVIDDEADSTTTAAPETGTTGSASVEIAGSTYEFTGAETCEIGPPGNADAAPTNPSGRTAEAMFTDGDDTVSLDVHETGISPFVTLEGVDYEGYGRAPLVEITDTGAVWTGELSADAGATLEEVTISISCHLVVK